MGQQQDLFGREPTKDQYDENFDESEPQYDGELVPRNLLYRIGPPSEKQLALMALEAALEVYFERQCVELRHAKSVTAWKAKAMETLGVDLRTAESKSPWSSAVARYRNWKDRDEGRMRAGGTWRTRKVAG
jgi:hypothetical protein